jgi:DNA-binding transcriptional ArsR family regulator
VLHTVQPAISRDLALLRNADLVAFERDGKWVEYRVVEPKNPVAAALLRDALKHIRQTREAIVDLERIAELGEGRAASLSDAPKPRRNKSEYV